MKNGERITTLTRLGLTLNEARAYLALIQSGANSAQKIAEASLISKQDIYRVMVSLEKTGVVEKTVIRPTVYKAAPVEQTIQILLQRKIAQQEDLQEKAKDLITSLESICSETETADSDFEVIMIPGKEHIINRLKEILEKTQKTLQVVTSRERFAPALTQFQEPYKNALLRGVKIQIAVESHDMEGYILKNIEDLYKKGEFEIRFFRETPESLVSVFDNLQASISMGTTANTSKAQALWSNDPAFVALAQNYFKNIWNNSTTINCRKADQS